MDLLLNNTQYLLFLTLLLILTIYPYTWLKVFLFIITCIYGGYLWTTGQHVFVISLFIIGMFLLYNLAKTVFHLV
jgi:hypothetical protein